MHHARSDKTDEIATSYMYKKTKNVYPFTSFHCKKYIEKNETVHGVNLVFQLFENILSL